MDKTNISIVYAFALINIVRFCICQCEHLQLTPHPIETNLGTLTGVVANDSGVEFTIFLGIPYAKPPVGARRLANPEPVEQWPNGRFTALSSGHRCPQNYGNDISEDCLVLDVWTPSPLNQSTRLPVMVFIHGGGYIIGDSRSYTGQSLVNFGQPVILVSIQYRLGLLGFASLGSDNRIPAMLGMKDQVLALQWVQDNIASFGGDKNRVTIFGESAGADSVLLHMVSPMSRGLFHRSIAQSSPSAWYIPRKNAYDGAPDIIKQAINCTGDIFDCLKGETWEAIITSSVNFPLRVVDGDFLTDDPINLYRNGQINEADLIIGFTNDDGDIILKEQLDFYVTSLCQEDILANGTTSRALTESVIRVSLLSTLSEFNVWGSADLQIVINDLAFRGKPFINEEQLFNIVRYAYVGATLEEPIQHARRLLDMARDSFTITYSVFAALEVAKHGCSSRLYSFEQRASTAMPLPPGGVPLYAGHISEIEFVFGYGLLPSLSNMLTAEEKVLARAMIQAWTSFATNGTSIFHDIVWPEIYENNKPYLRLTNDIGKDSIKDMAYTWLPIAEFWMELQDVAILSDDIEEDGSEDEIRMDDIEEDGSEDEIRMGLLNMTSFGATWLVNRHTMPRPIHSQHFKMQHRK